MSSSPTVPNASWYRRSAYLKIRDRESYEFALCSAAIALDLDGSKIRDARIAAGGVGTKPWRFPGVAGGVVGKKGGQNTFGRGGELAAQDARPFNQKPFK